MDLKLTEEQIAVREAFAALFRDESPPSRVRSAEASGFDEPLWHLYASVGALGVGVPPELGGDGGGLLDLALVAEEAGRRLASIPFVEAAAGARLLARLGDGKRLAPVLDGSRIIAIATGTGPLERQVLSSGAIAHAALVLAGDSVRYVPRPAGLSSLPAANVGALPLARWTGAGPGTPLAAAGASRAVFERALDEIRVLRAAALAGLAAEAITIGARYAATRHAFGQPIGAYQAVAHPLADAVTATDGARLLTWKACWALDAGRADGPELAAMAFAFAAEAAFHAAQHSLHVHGGYGFTQEYDIQLYYRRAKAWATVFADPRRELLTVADRRFGPAVTAGEQAAVAADALGAVVAAASAGSS
jgi:alkylation response protein AidB-like acyl-CoA dehydrogenase